jgi:NAD(P)-dependent dehydrogenase (short-subunit alcohol dehydrogenase family)
VAACVAHDTEPGESDREHDAVATVLIIGASRGVGLETVKAALQAGHSVRALARSAQRIPIDRPKLEKMAGDALETATVKRALSGVGAVIQSLGVSAGLEVILKPTRFFSKATRVLVTAMEETNVKRLICVTGFGAGDSRGHGGFVYNLAFHLLLGRVYDDKDVQEWIVRRSNDDAFLHKTPVLTSSLPTSRSEPTRPQHRRAA